MALDVHPGKSRKAAIRRKRWAFLNEHAYDALLEKISLPSSDGSAIVLRCPLLNRLQDF
ncbi:MAG: hypothetical protein KME43_12090 [Myxacorys chilensis ATA2-1-KO14]|jgi:hypothetical protein|nr:hypothetical protein [Myxacorys chilensis ATA2-1-KO14]